MNEEISSYWDYSEPEQIEYINELFKTKIYLDKWWVSEHFPFTVHRLIDEEKSGALGYMKKCMQSFQGSSPGTFMQGTLKLLHLLDKEYFNSYENEPMYDDQPLYNYAETARMFSNIKMVEHLKIEQTMIPKHTKDIQIQINSLIKKIKNYQEKYPERII